MNEAIPTPSRAMNIDQPRADVIAACAKHKAPLSAIEDLLSGGTRAVFMNGDDAATMRRVFAKKLITGNVVRTRWVRNG
jgi:hypothetical protein